MNVNRWINDRMSWVISLDLDGVQAPESRQGVREFKDDPAVFNNFTLSRHVKDSETDPYEYRNVMVYDMLVHPLLRYQYLISDKTFLAFCRGVFGGVWDAVKGTLTPLPVEVQEYCWPW